MGNRAVIATSDMPEAIGIYLHWNGGRDSVESFLKYCELKGYEPPSLNGYCLGYSFARLCQVIGNFFGGTCSIGIDKLYNLDVDNGDNGLYIINGWKIVGRKYAPGREQNEYDMKEILLAIDEAQPESEQIGEYISAEETDDWKIGDTAVFLRWDGKVETVKVIGYGEEGRIVNGTDVSGIPYVDRYGHEHPENNINNYLRPETGARKKVEKN